MDNGTCPYACNIRGQSIPMDLIAGVFVFILAISYFVILWDSYQTKYLEEMRARKNRLAAISVAEQLASSPGQPFNWTGSPSSAQAIGLAIRQRELDPVRVKALQMLAAANYSEAKRLLGVDEDFLIKIETMQGARLITIGQEASNETFAYEVSRLVYYNGSGSHLKVRIYEV
ncbi:MAG: hypothetical protein N3G22_04245 [Candidatus Micrarchaeota archaeon]|nr:hypothetical protein [Candidatus Micrarchaeota archaeon]